MAFNVVLKKVKNGKKLFSDALTYLKQSDIAEMIISELERTKTKITVEIDGNAAAKNGFLVTKQNVPMVRWNPTYMLQTGFDIARSKGNKGYCGMVVQNLSGFLSPSLLLLHELGHAYQYLSETKEYKDQVAAMNAAISDEAELLGSREEAMLKLKKEGKLVLEEANVAGLENNVALQLRNKGYPEGLRWWDADNIMQKTKTDRISPLKN